MEYPSAKHVLVGRTASVISPFYSLLPELNTVKPRQVKVLKVAVVNRALASMH